VECGCTDEEINHLKSLIMAQIKLSAKEAVEHIKENPTEQEQHQQLPQHQRQQQQQP